MTCALIAEDMFDAGSHLRVPMVGRPLLLVQAAPAAALAVNAATVAAPAQLLYHHQNSDPPPPATTRGVSSPIDPLLLRCLSKDPDARGHAVKLTRELRELSALVGAQLTRAPKTSLPLTVPDEGTGDGDADHNPREVMQAALNLSKKRAAAVREAVVAYAKANGITLDSTQMQPVGVGIREPFMAQPRTMEDARQNMRVEFRLLRVDAEVAASTDFDY